MDLTNAMGLITERRTNLRIDPDRPVATEVIEDLCAAATWAPNHKLTQPWRFAVLTGGARATLGEIVAQALSKRGVTDQSRLVSAAAKYLRAPVVLIVGCPADPDPIRHTEDRDAVAAGVQNLLLAATAAGLASYWATGRAARLPETVELCRFEPGTEVVAIIYLGWPVADAPVPRRRPAIIQWLPSKPGSRPNASQ